MEATEGAGRSRLALLVTVVLAASAFAGCVEAGQQAARLAANAADCVDASGVDSGQTSFAYGGFASCKTTEESHTWRNPSPYADVQWGGGVVEGSVKVTILDSMEREIYTVTLDGNASLRGEQTQTDPGFPANPTTGGWTIELDFQNFTGTMGLELTPAAS